ncbi:hypothetical protein V5N11_016960 [Cardamine amara subsp. amara]|uniref:Uncharacterized protein n=1 Tax=Cardamine amara subsp. amara TaxID=228776 RepID=A0ABD1B8B9_CARAN
MSTSDNDEPSHMDDKAPLWIYVKKIEKQAGGGSWRSHKKKLVNDCKKKIKRVAPKTVPLPSSSNKVY